MAGVVLMLRRSGRLCINGTTRRLYSMNFSKIRVCIAACLLLFPVFLFLHKSEEAIGTAEDFRIYETTRNPHKFNAIIQPQRCTEETELLLSVHSAASYMERRNVLRSTWASTSMMVNITGMNTKILFVLGNNATLKSAIEDESKQYGDILQMDFTDHYRNNTYKALYHLRWVHENCRGVKIVMKTDDDMLMHPDKLRNMFTEVKSQLSKSKRLYMGNFGEPLAAAPQRNPLDAWFISWHEYPYATFPPFSFGGCYFLSPSITKEIFTASITTPYIFMDDVFLGMLVHKIGNVQIVNLRIFFPWRSSQTIFKRPYNFILASWQGYNNIAVYHMPLQDTYNSLWQIWERNVKSVIPEWHASMYIRYYIMENALFKLSLLIQFYS